MQFSSSTTKCALRRSPDTFGWWLTDLEDLLEPQDSGISLSICTESCSDNTQPLLHRRHSDVLPTMAAPLNPPAAASCTTLSQMRNRRFRLGHTRSSSSLLHGQCNFNQESSIFSRSKSSHGGYIHVPRTRQFEALPMSRRNCLSSSHLPDNREASSSSNQKVNHEEFVPNSLQENQKTAIDRSLQESKQGFRHNHQDPYIKASVPSRLQDDQEVSISSYLQNTSEDHIPHSVQDHQNTLHTSSCKEGRDFQGSDNVCMCDSQSSHNDVFSFHQKIPESSAHSCPQENQECLISSCFLNSLENSSSRILPDVQGSSPISLHNSLECFTPGSHQKSQEMSTYISHQESEATFKSKYFLDKEENYIPSCHQEVRGASNSSLFEEIVETSSANQLQSTQGASTPLSLKNSSKFLTASTLTSSHLQLQRLLQQWVWCRQSHANHLTSLALSIEQDSSPARRQLEAPKTAFLATASMLDNELRALTSDAAALHEVAAAIEHDMKSAETAAIRLTDEARQLVSDLRDLQFLDDLILLLQGQLECITLQRWPFSIARLPGKVQNLPPQF